MCARVVWIRGIQNTREIFEVPAMRATESVFIVGFEHHDLALDAFAVEGQLEIEPGVFGTRATTRLERLEPHELPRSTIVFNEVKHFVSERD